MLVPSKEYDISTAFEAVENELIQSMMRNMRRHRVQEITEGKEWMMWQAEQLKALELYRKDNRKKFTKQFSRLNKEIDELLRQARQTGSMDQEEEILNAIANGFKGYRRRGKTVSAAFFAMNDRKLNALIKATTQDMKRAETAVLRMANDRYRKIIFNAQVYANTGAGTYEKAVDMATRDYLSAGLNCVEYVNGARHTLADYADMAIRTASKRAYLAGEGEKRQEWGITTVILNKRGNPCPKCLPFAGKVLIDDVWSGGKKEDGPYPLMSTAIAAGLYHPRCKDSHTTYFPGVSTADDKWTKAEMLNVKRASARESKKQYATRQAKRFGRLAEYSMDADNQRRYLRMAEKWNAVAGNQKTNRTAVDYKSGFIEMLKKSPKEGRHYMKIRMYAEATDFLEDANLEYPYAYDPVKDAIRFNPELSERISADAYQILAHEIMHRMDVLEYRSWENEGFKKAIESTREKVYNHKAEIESWFIVGGKYQNNALLSDIISALTQNGIDIPFGHDEKYWASPKSVALEVFANLGGLDLLGDVGSDELNGILSDLYAAYKEVTK